MDEDVSESPDGLPAGCHVTSMKRGLPMPMRSMREIRLMAPDFVRGGKNSREKNLSFDSIRVKIFSLRVASKELQPPGEFGLQKEVGKLIQWGSE